MLDYGGALAVTNGFSNRAFVGFSDNFFYKKSFGLHLDGAQTWREQNAGFLSAGVSYRFEPGITPKVLVGTSSQNTNILPRFFALGSVSFDFGPGVGVVLTPSYTYREFRNGTDESTLSVETAKYFPAFANGSYFVGQARASAILANPHAHLGYEFAASLTLMFPNAWNIGAELFGGTQAYDSLIAASPGVQNEFVGMRPKIGVFLTRNTEVFMRGEFVHTKLYDISGGLLGLKVTF